MNRRGQRFPVENDTKKLFCFLGSQSASSKSRDRLQEGIETYKENEDFYYRQLRGKTFLYKLEFQCQLMRKLALTVSTCFADCHRSLICVFIEHSDDVNVKINKIKMNGCAQLFIDCCSSTMKPTILIEKCIALHLHAFDVNAEEMIARPCDRCVVAS